MYFIRCLVPILLYFRSWCALKTIGIIIDSDLYLADFLIKNLKIVLKDYVQINYYLLEELKDEDKVNDDVVLVMSKERSVEAKKYIYNTENIVLVHRTIKEEDRYKIFAIPKNTKVLVVNDTKETTLETVALLYQIGVKDINLIPYEESKDFSNIEIAITPGVSRRVPDYIRETVDIGNRYIDMSTFIEIINKLKLDNKEISKRLLAYSDSILTLDSGIKKQYKELYAKYEELDIVINLSNEGILLVNKDDEILLNNKAFRRIFGIGEDIIGRKLHEVFNEGLTRTFARGDLFDELIEFNNKYIIINKQSISYQAENTGYYYNFQEVTYIKQLEQNLSKKMRDKGLIARYSFDYIITESKSMKDCIELAKRISDSELTVFITGESGTGKELFAQSIHNASKRSKQPFVAVNCAAVAESLLESELFGYDEGAFTGALKGGKIGLFELANNGTIFLDEIGDMPLLLQTRLLRVLQERQVMRIGSQRVINTNIRVIAATNKNLKDMVQKGLFRKDLYYRINVLPINIPPLRKRKEDVIHLMQHFIGRPEKLELEDDVKSLLLNYDWPGNIRELQNVASYIKLMNEKELTLEKLPYYLVYQEKSFEKELSLIEENFGMAKVLEIMNMIQKYCSQNMSIGRRKIETLSKEYGLNTNESEVRRILTLLNELKLVASHSGKGTELTGLGNVFLQWVENGIER